MDGHSLLRHPNFVCEIARMDVNERTIRKRGSTILNTRISIFSFKVFVARSIGMFAHPLYFPSNQFYRSFKGGKVSALLISTFYSSVRISLRKSRDSFVHLCALFPPLQALEKFILSTTCVFLKLIFNCQLLFVLSMIIYDYLIVGKKFYFVIQIIILKSNSQ